MPDPFYDALSTHVVDVIGACRTYVSRHSISAAVRGCKDRYLNLARKVGDSVRGGEVLGEAAIASYASASEDEAVEGATLDGDLDVLVRGESARAYPVHCKVQRGAEVYFYPCVPATAGFFR